jgi:hypothetical protein
MVARLTETVTMARRGGGDRERMVTGARRAHLRGENCAARWSRQLGQVPAAPRTLPNRPKSNFLSLKNRLLGPPPQIYDP